MVKEDLPSVAKLEKLCFKRPWSQEDIEREMDLNPFFNGMVLEEGIVISYALFDTIFEDGHLARIGTDPEFQKRGLGAKMLKAALNQAKDKGCETFYLEVRPSNAPALALYASAGFQTFRKIRHHYDDGEDAWGMSLQLKDTKQAEKAE